MPKPFHPSPPLASLASRLHPDPAVRRLLAGELLSLCATSTGHAAIAWWLAQQAGASGLTLYGGLMAALALVALPLLSPLGDRGHKAGLVRWGQVLLMLDALALCIAALTGQLGLALMCVCGGVATVAQALAQPALNSLLPDLVQPVDLPHAIRKRRGAQALGSLMGPALGGAALALGGVGGATGAGGGAVGAVAAGTGAVGAGAGVALAFGLQWLLAASAWWAWRKLSAPARTLPGAPGRNAERAPWWPELRAGLRAKWQVRVDRDWSLCAVLMMLFFGPATGLLVPLRLQSLGLSAAWFGACTGAMSLGVLVGVSGAADRLMRRWGRWRAMLGAIAVCGVCLAGIGLCAWAPGLVMLFAVIGVALSITQLTGQTHRALAVPEDFRARLAAAQLMLVHLSATAAPLVAGLCLQRGSVAQVYGLMAGGFLLSGLMLLAVPELRLFLSLPVESVKGWYGRRYPAAFRSW